MVGMLVLNWKLALFAFALLPLFVILTRRVGNERRRIAKTTQETLADISSLVQESLSVSGILLGKTMGRGSELADRFEADSLRLAALEVRQRMAGRWVMAAIQTSFADHARRGLLVRRPRARARLARDLRSRCSSRSPRCRRASSSRSARCSASASTSRRRSRSSTASSSTSTRRSTSSRSPTRSPKAAPATSCSTTCRSSYVDEWTLQDVSFTVRAGTTTALVGETGSGKTTLGYLAARLYDVDRGRITIGGTDIRDLTLAGALPSWSESCRRRPTSSTRPCARTSPSPSPTRPTRRSRRQPRPRASTT